MLQQRSEGISPEEALDLLTKADTAELIAMADKVRRQRHGANVYHVHSLNLNPTNLCENRCGLCAFWREPGSNEAYTLSLPQAQDRLATAKGWGLTDVHIVGGLNRELNLDYYLELLRITKRVLPETAVQALTAVEIQWLSDRILEHMKDRGYLLGKTGPGRNVLTWMPPLIIRQGELTEAVEALEKTLQTL